VAAFSWFKLVHSHIDVSCGLSFSLSNPQNYIQYVSFFFFFFKDFIYLFDRETVREGTQEGGVGEGEAGFPPSREPDMGRDPRMLGS